MAESVITVAEAKAWLRVDGDDEDAIIEMLIKTASAVIETYIRRPVIGADEGAVCAEIGDVPEDLKTAACMAVALLFENRAATAEDVRALLQTSALLDPYIDWSAR